MARIKLQPKTSSHAPGQRLAKVFLSHSREDSVLAGTLRQLLSQELGASVFVLQDVSAGEDWQRRLQKELQTAEVVVVLLTPHSANSSWVLQEIGAAWSLDKPIIPVVTQDSVLDRFPMQLRDHQYFHMKDLETTEGADRFVRTVERALHSVPSAK